jgi:hypothetical protein
MKRWAIVLIVIGSGLAAFGFSGWHAAGNPLIGLEGPADWNFSAGWSLSSQVEITVGIALLAFGITLRRDSN